MKLILLFLLLLFSCEKKNLSSTSVEENLNQFDNKIFSILFTSYMWEITNVAKFENKKEFSTDEISGKQFEWIRFRSAAGDKLGDALDFCLGIKNHQNSMDLYFSYMNNGQTCEESKSVVEKVIGLKRAVWVWPTPSKSKELPQLKLKFEWIEDGKWRALDFLYPLPHYPVNHQSLSWQKTWKNQIPVSDNQWITPLNTFFVKLDLQNLRPIRFQKIPHQKSDNWQNASVCFSVDDQCHPLIPNQCHLCEKGFFTLYNSQCATVGTSYCGEIKCGQRGQPACYLGKEHIKQTDFKGCSPFTEEWICQKGLEIKCNKFGAVCY